MAFIAQQDRLDSIERANCQYCSSMHGRFVKECIECHNRIEGGQLVAYVDGHSRQRGAKDADHDRTFTYRYRHASHDGIEAKPILRDDDGNESNGHDATAIPDAGMQAMIETMREQLAGKDQTIDTLSGTLSRINSRLDALESGKTIETTSAEETNDYEHALLAKLVMIVQALDPKDRNVWLTGTPGSGKTHVARQLAAKLGIAFGMTGAVDTEYKLLGFTDAGGRVVNTEFRRIWCNGGVFLFDEIDISLPPAVMAFNGALANGHAVFPDGELKRHKDTVIIAAANTWGYGDIPGETIGRNKQDATTLDRFAKLHWTIDESLERDLALGRIPSNTASVPLWHDHSDAAIDAWIDAVQAVRRAVDAARAKVAITPRATMRGAQLLRGGFSRQDVIDITMGSGITKMDSWLHVGAAMQEWARG